MQNSAVFRVVVLIILPPILRKKFVNIFFVFKLFEPIIFGNFFSSLIASPSINLSGTKAKFILLYFLIILSQVPIGTVVLRQYVTSSPNLFINLSMDL